MTRATLRSIGILLATLGIFIAVLLVSSLITTEKRLVIGSYEDLTEKPFYTLPTKIPEGKPGQLFRSEKLGSVPNGMNGWRIIYYSTDFNNKSILVSGLVAAPDTANTSTKRSVVSWGHPTTGIAPRCAPSVGIDPFDSIEGLRALVTAGYVVAATDYAGMGLSGPPSFLIGDTEGRNVLDAAKAAQQIPEANANSDVVLWGHSQGGHASLFANQISQSYAPDLTIKATAVAAPATKLGQLLEDDSVDVSGITIGSYAIDAYSEAYNVPMDTILTPEGVAATPSMTRLCLLGQNAAIHKIANPLIGKYFASDPSTTEPWATMLKQNTPGGSKINGPVFVAQGEIDTLVRPSVTTQFVTEQRAAGVNITYLQLPGIGHPMVALKSIDQIISWLKAL